MAGNPEGAGAVFAKYSKVATAEQLGAMLRSHTHHYHPSGVGLRQEIKLYAQDLKDVSVFKPATDPRSSGPGLRGHAGRVIRRATSMPTRDPRPRR